jgi:hypothetical protein
MLTPIVDAAPGSAEDFYTKRHCAARNRVERTIGLLKARWRCLLKDRVLHYKPEMVAKMVNACCVLHNKCNRSRLPSPDMGSEQVYDEPHLDASTQPPHLSQPEELRRGQDARERIVQSLWWLRGH